MSAHERPRPQLLPAGRVGRAHGLDGSFYVTRPVARLLRVGALLTLADGSAAAIVRRSGTSVQQVSRLIKQFAQMRGVMRQLGRGKLPDLGALMRGAR